MAQALNLYADIPARHWLHHLFGGNHSGYRHGHNHDLASPACDAASLGRHGAASLRDDRDESTGQNHRWTHFTGYDASRRAFDLAAFGAAVGVMCSLAVQIGEQVDYLRFLPEKTSANKKAWWCAVLLAGPGWIIIGGLKILAGSFLAVLVLSDGGTRGAALEPVHMYLSAYGSVFRSPSLVLFAAALFVVMSQVKINVTNAYAGSLAWSNFFSRLTHYHAGRVVWLVFNILISLLLMLLGIFDTLEVVLIYLFQSRHGLDGRYLGGSVRSEAARDQPRFHRVQACTLA